MSLILTGVTHRYPGADDAVLVDVDLAADPGETVALVGPSGSGKSTLLAVAGGLLAPTRGTVALAGGPVGPGRRRTDIAWVFQGSNALLDRSVIDNVVLRALAAGRRRVDVELAAADRLARVGLAGAGPRLARTLSGGELQRVCVARALLGDPRLVCADEPTGQLDAAATEEVVAALLGTPGRRASPRAVVLVATHDPEVAACCDRVVRVERRLAPVLGEAAP